MLPVAAIILDGKATAATIKAELATRVAALKQVRSESGAGHHPGRRRPRQSFVRRWQASRLCRSRHRQHPSRPPRRRHRRQMSSAPSPSSTTTRPAPATSCSFPCPRVSTPTAVLALMDPDKDADGLHPMNLGRLVLGEDAPLPCTPRGIVELLRRLRRADRRRRGGRRRPRCDGRASARAAAHPAQRERHGHALPHRHPRPASPPGAGRHHRGGSRCPRAGHRRCRSPWCSSA